MLFKFVAVVVCQTVFVQAVSTGYWSCTNCVWHECPPECGEIKKDGFFTKVKSLFKGKPKTNESVPSECYSCGDACATYCDSYAVQYYTPVQPTQPAPVVYYQEPTNYVSPYTPQCSYYCHEPSCIPCPRSDAYNVVKPTKAPRATRKPRDIRCRRTSECTDCEVEVTKIRRTEERTTTRRKCSRNY